jgi:hypothetical protein
MLLLAVALAAAPQSNVPQPPSRTSTCPATTRYLAGAGIIYHGKPLTPQRLIELPDANLYLTVYRRIDGCEAPIVVKYGVNRR